MSIFNTQCCCDDKKTEEDKTRRYSLRQLLTMQDELNTIVKEGWKGTLTEDNFLVALIDEYGGEVLGSGLDWKHWKYTDPSSFDPFNLKIEITDTAFFWLSVLILRLNKVTNNNISMTCGCDEDPYNQFDGVYIGADKGTSSTSGILCNNTNALDHSAYISLLRRMICEKKSGDIFYDMETLDAIVSSVGMTSTVFSAFYACKYELNVFRQSAGYLDGSYEKVVDGKEDNERLEEQINAFLSDKTMTLETLRNNVIDAFFDPVTP